MAAPYRACVRSRSRRLATNCAAHKLVSLELLKTLLPKDARNRFIPTDHWKQFNETRAVITVHKLMGRT